MSQKIHSTAIVSKQAKIGANVEIGPFCVIGDHVEIGDNSILKSHVVIEGNTVIGKNNVIFPFAVIGVVPQDLKYTGEKTWVKIGNGNNIREHVTIHAGTATGISETVIGDNCLLMVATHIAHDCVIGNNVVFANNATLGGHVEVGDNAVIGGLSAIHQFVRIGKFVMIGGMSGVESDVIPYGLVVGERAHLAGLNLTGMKRHNIDRENIHALRGFFKELTENKNKKSFIERANEIGTQNDSKTVDEVLKFINSKTNRQFCQPKNDNL